MGRQDGAECGPTGARSVLCCHRPGPLLSGQVHKLTYSGSGCKGVQGLSASAGDTESHPRAQLGMVSCNPGEYSAGSVPSAGFCLCNQRPGKGKEEVQDYAGLTAGPR